MENYSENISGKDFVKKKRIKEFKHQYIINSSPHIDCHQHYQKRKIFSPLDYISNNDRNNCHQNQNKSHQHVQYIRNYLPDIFYNIKFNYFYNLENSISKNIIQKSNSICSCCKSNSNNNNTNNNNNNISAKTNEINTHSHSKHQTNQNSHRQCHYNQHQYYSNFHLTRHTLSFYAASSVLLVLCYLTSPIKTSETSPIFDESSSDKEILDHLLKNSRYDKRLLPPVNGTLTINVNVLLLSLASPDESSLKYEVEFLLNQQWTDPRLEYGNRSQYEYLNAIHHHEDLWLPDTYFIMHGDFKDPIIPMHFNLRIFRNGTITYAMRRHLILSCQGSINIFPFDDPLCTFAIESISYELNAIKYVWKNDEDTIGRSPSLTSLNAYLIKNATINCPIKSWRGNYSCLKVELTFTRDRAFYFTTVFIPGIILVTSSFITFWLEWNAVPARVMIGVTTMLNFFTTSNGFRSTLPVVSNLTAMNVWDGVCMCFIYASLLEFVCVNYVGRKRPLHNVVYRPGENPVTQRLPAVLSRIGVILASPLKNRIEQEFLAAVSETTAQPITNIQSIQSQSQYSSNIQDSHQEHHDDDRGSMDKNIDDQIQQNQTISTIQSSMETQTEIKEQKAPIAMYDVELGTTDNTEHNLDTHNENIPPTVVISNVNVQCVEIQNENYPIKPPRRRIRSRNITPSREIETNKDKIQGNNEIGEKKKESSGPNEIVACTCASGSSPCTHSANNGCATETCFVQIRKKEPPHPIRVAKTIDVIARVTFPTAYAIFLIFFFIHYKGFY